MPAGLVLEGFLAADAGLFHKKWALWARLVVFVASVLDLGMAAGLWASAIKVAGWRASSTWLRRMKSRSTAGAADFVEYSLQAT